MTTDTTIPAQPKPKFRVLQDVYRVSHGGYSGALLEGRSKRISFSKTTVAEVKFIPVFTGWGSRRKQTGWKEEVRCEGSSRFYPATKSYLWTEAEYAKVKDRVEAQLQAKSDAAADLGRRRRAYVQSFIAFAAQNPEAAVDLVLSGRGLRLPSGAVNECTVCWEAHNTYTDYDHPARPIQ